MKLKELVQESVKNSFDQHFPDRHKQVDEMFDPASIAIGAGVGAGIGAGVMALYRKFRQRQQQIKMEESNLDSREADELLAVMNTIENALDTVAAGGQIDVRMFESALNDIERYKRTSGYRKMIRSDFDLYQDVIEDLEEAEDVLNNFRTLFR